jgi:EAL domain-containing protein (putative c-di-GMP-specific phosphodiesterase class I)/GGDEF domain-containing protein/CBS domain-containing protein
MISLLNNIFWQKNKQKLSGLGHKFAFQHQKLTRPKLLNEIANHITQRRSVVVLYFDLVKFTEIEQNCGDVLSKKILDQFKNTLHSEMPRLLWNLRILAVENLWGDDYVVIFSADRKPDSSVLHNLALACRLALKESLSRDLQRISIKPMEIHVGYSLFDSKIERADINLYRAVREAQEIAKGTIDLQKAQLLNEFKSILDQGNINMVYQPIVSFKKGTVIGWEALARGPQGSHFLSPGVMFPFAEEADLLFELEKLCRRKAIQRLGGLGTDQKLFLNIHPQTIKDPNFVQGETLKIIESAGLEPKNIVFEITERHSVDDYLLINRIMDHYRNQGFLVAVDDAGSGFSSLQSIAELRPDFIKIDISLVQGIHQNSLKRTLMETMISFSEKIGCAIIAEGIEEEDELNTLAAIGVHHGQGYLIGKPLCPKQLPEEWVSRKLLKQASLDQARVVKHVFTIRDLAENVTTVQKDAKVKDIQRLLENNELFPGIVVLDQDRPVGLAMRNQLFNFLGSQYGVPLYYEKPIVSIMDKHPLIVDDSSPIELASQLAMNRKKTKIYDYIIIVNSEGLFYGVVSIQNLHETMTRIHIDTARGANPLSGLPGSVAIEEELNRRISEKKAYSFIYLDLDRFKSYNDHYGFERGNSVILFTARLLKKILIKYGKEDDFIGHIGGDDYIIITANSCEEIICNKVIRYFDRLIKTYYDPCDRKNGFVPGHDRNCQECEYPIVSISLAVVSGNNRKKTNMRTISEKAAQLKSYAKSIPGSNFVRDRRIESPLDPPLTEITNSNNSE